MTHYNVSYKGMDRKQADEKAICDILEYLGSNRLPLFGDLVAMAVHVENAIPMNGQDGEPHVQKFQSLNMMFGFAGISGYPFHAFARRYCPNKYREWMTSGTDVYEMDDENFPIKAKEG